MKLLQVGSLLVAACLTASCGSIVVTKVDTPTAVSNGMVYALPKTVVRIQVKLDRTAREGAAYSAYAAIFAPDGDVICKDPTCTAELPLSYSLQNGATFSTYGEPDPAEVYLVKFSGSGTVDQSMSMTWNEAGLLSSAGASVTNRASDVVMSGLKLVAGLSAKGLFGAAVVKDASGFHCPKKNGQTANDNDVLEVLDNSGGFAKADLKDRYCAIDPAQRATMTINKEVLEEATKAFVAKIFPLTVARAQILDGTQQALAPGQLIEKIDAEISARLANLYLGAKDVKTWEGTLDVRGIAKSSTPGSGASIDVLKINKAKGFCVQPGAAIAPESKPFPKGIAELPVGSSDCNSGDLVKLSWSFHPAPASQLSNIVKDDPEGDRSFRYRVPSQIKAELIDPNSVKYGVGVMWIAQLGPVLSLPAKRSSKSLSYDLAFIESTGALKSFKLATTGGVDAGTIDSLTEASGTVLDAQNARAEKRKEAKDEVNVLTREATLLEMRDKICTLRLKYGQKCEETEQ